MEVLQERSGAQAAPGTGREEVGHGEGLEGWTRSQGWAGCDLLQLQGSRLDPPRLSVPLEQAGRRTARAEGAQPHLPGAEGAQAVPGRRRRRHGALVREEVAGRSTWHL